MRSLILNLTRDCVTLFYGVYKVQYIMPNDDLNLSGDDLRDCWAHHFSDLSGELSTWIEKLKKATNCQRPRDFSQRNLKKLGVDVLAGLLLEGCQVGSSYIDFVDDARTKVENLKLELIESQRSEIKLQKNLIELQSEQLKSVSTAVDTAIENGMKSYSNVLTDSVTKPEPTFTEEKLKKVVQEAVAEEDRSRNIMVFGVSEETGEDLNGTIGAVFEEISEKPTFEAARIGRVESGKVRPIKVSLRSSAAVHQILAKARKLKTSSSYRSVYIGPDRSPEERVKQKELLTEMKRKANEDNSKHYYVRSGRICSKDKIINKT